MKRKYMILGIVVLLLFVVLISRESTLISDDIEKYFPIKGLHIGTQGDRFFVDNEIELLEFLSKSKVRRLYFNSSIDERNFKGRVVFLSSESNGIQLHIGNYIYVYKNDKLYTFVDEECVCEYIEDFLRDNSLYIRG